MTSNQRRGILLLAPSIESLQKLVTICATELASLDMSINGNKSVCKPIDPRFNKHCVIISIQDGQELNWLKSCRYLGITVEIASHFIVTLVKLTNCVTAPLMQSLVEWVELPMNMLPWNY